MKMKRYVTIDFLRAVSIFMMIFLHLVSDLYNMSWVDSDESLAAAPVGALLLLLPGLYFGAWAGLFLMVSAMGNMISMHKNLERGKSIKSIVTKQVVGGFILLFFSFLAEGTLQYYAVYQTIRMGEPDFTRIWWKSYTMETIATIAWCMVINGVIQGLLSLNGGFKKIKRNMIIYAVLAVAVFALTQPVWDLLKTIVPGYPFDPNNTGRDIQYPSANPTFWEFIWKFFFMALGGHPEPLFPFLAVSFIGSIFALAILRDDVSRSWPRKGVLVGVGIFIFGLAFWAIGDLPFDSLLPLGDFSTFSRIGRGLDWRWLPWVCFITGGQVVLVSLMFRFVEFRGKSQKFAEKSAFVRRFGMIPFTLYTFHRIIAMLPLLALTFIFGRDMTIDVHNLTGWVTLGAIAVVLLFIHGLLRLWERVDYIGGLEWMIGTIGAYATGYAKREGEYVPWYRRGAMDQKEAFYDVEWIDIFEAGDNGGKELRDSRLAFKFALCGLVTLLMFPATLLGLAVARSSKEVEGENKYNRRAWLIGLVALVVNTVLIVVFCILTVGDLGISF